MEYMREVLKRGWRGVFVMCAIGVPLSIIVRVTSRIPVPIEYPAISLSGAHYKDVHYKSLNQQLGNAAVQAVTIDTSSYALNETIAGIVNDKVKTFIATLPATPTVPGFIHQLRVIPKVDYSSENKISLTLEIDEYHPIGTVTTHFESWIARDGTVEQPILNEALVKQLSRVLHIPEKALENSIDAPFAMGLLPNYKVRLYASGALLPYIATPYKDISLSQLPEVATLYRKQFYATYPPRFSPNAQTTLDDEYLRAVARTLTPTNCVLESCLALTFDDGPDPDITPKILRILADNSVHATFFALGNQIQRSPELTMRVAAAGHEVESHTFSHPDLIKLHTPALIRKQIDDTERSFNGVGLHAKFLRPPYGSIDDNVRAVANMPIVMWNIDSQEWRQGTTPTTMAGSVISQTRPGAIILMHDTKAITAEALPIVITQLKARGFRFVTVAQLLQIDGNARGIFASK